MEKNVIDLENILWKNRTNLITQDIKIEVFLLLEMIKILFYSRPLQAKHLHLTLYRH